MRSAKIFILLDWNWDSCDRLSPVIVRPFFFILFGIYWHFQLAKTASLGSVVDGGSRFLNFGQFISVSHLIEIIKTKEMCPFFIVKVLRKNQATKMINK